MPGICKESRKEHGVEVIHLSSCIAGFCPNRILSIKALADNVGLEVKEMTHRGLNGKRFPVGPDGKPLMPEELYAISEEPGPVRNQ